MPNQISLKLIYLTIAAYVAALLVWTVLFFRNPLLKEVLVDIHLIFSCTIVAYLLVRLIFSLAMMDFIKVFIRTLFRVWLLIFITFAISRSMDRVGTLLSLTFMFGYFEGLLDINKWLETKPSFVDRYLGDVTGNKVNHAMATILLMCVVHVLCAVAVMGFYLLF